MAQKPDTRRQVTIPLRFPVQLADRTLTEITVRRPIMRDLAEHPGLGKGGIDEDLAFTAALTGLVRDELEMLDVADYEALQEQILRFRGAAIPQRRAAPDPAAAAAGENVPD